MKSRETAELDALVRDTIARRMQKAVVVAPKDPNGGAKLPRRQEGASNLKVDGKVQYPAVFDRNASDSNRQMDDWLDATQEEIQSPDDFVADAREDDAPEDYDTQQWEDNRREDPDAVYDPLTDDDDLDEDDLESLELPEDDEEYVTVKRHKRRKVSKSTAAARGDMDEDFADLSDDDDLDEGGEGEEDENDGGDKKRKPKKGERRRVRKSRRDDPEEEDEDEQDELDDDERDIKDARRRKEVRKALGADAMDLYNGNQFAKSLVDAVLDIQESLTSEIRALRMENRKLTRQMAGLVKQQNRALAKSLTEGQMVIAGFGSEEASAQAPQRQALRKSVTTPYGAAVRTTQRVTEPVTDLTKAFDALEDAYTNPQSSDVRNPALMNAMTMLENDGVAAVEFLPKSAKDVLRKAKLLA